MLLPLNITSSVHVDVGQEVHLDLDDAVALAGLAAPALDVEREAARRIAARLGLGQAGEPVADRREAAGIGRRVGARRAADRRLVDIDDLVDQLDALDAVVHGGMLARAVELLGQRLVERLDDQRRLAAARDAGDAGEGAERQFDGDVLQIVGPSVDDADLLPLVAGAALGWDGNLPDAGEVLAGDALGIGHHRLGLALGDDMAAMDAGRRPHVDEVVGAADGVLVMLDDDDRVAEIAQPLQRLQEPGIVALVQPDRRLVEHVEHAGEARADLRGEADALALAARQRARGARQAEIIESDILEEAEPLVDLLEDARGDLAMLG